jgi:nucleoside-diphosphate-sugar epimerase
MAKILIVGCGEIGLAFGQLIAKQGHQVIGLKRNPPPNMQLINFFRADIRIPAQLEHLDDDFEQIFFILSADGRTESDYQDVYGLGLNNLLAKFSHSQSKPNWWMVSSTSVYGQTNGEWVDELSPANPISPTAKYIRAAEQRIVDEDLRNIVIRFSGIYGTGREYLLRMAKQIPEIQKEPPYYTNRIHSEDCVEVLAFLLNQRLLGRKLEQYYLASDDTPATQWEVMSWLAEQMSLEEPSAKYLTGAVDCNKRCSNLRLKQLGFNFIYPSFKEGYGKLLG